MGKSTLVTQLAEKVNISNILQTSVVKNVMDNFGQSSGPSGPQSIEMQPSRASAAADTATDVV